MPYIDAMNPKTMIGSQQRNLSCVTDVRVCIYYNHVG